MPEEKKIDAYAALRSLIDLCVSKGVFSSVDEVVVASNALNAMNAKIAELHEENEKLKGDQ